MPGSRFPGPCGGLTILVNVILFMPVFLWPWRGLWGGFASAGPCWWKPPTGAAGSADFRRGAARRAVSHSSLASAFAVPAGRSWAGRGRFLLGRGRRGLGRRGVGLRVPARGFAQPGAAPAGTAGGPVAERRVCSVLFCDVVGFTPLSEARDPEAVRELLSGYFAVARTVITRYGGGVEEFIGDAVVAVWGTPAATEEDAER